MNLFVFSRFVDNVRAYYIVGVAAASIEDAIQLAYDFRQIEVTKEDLLSPCVGISLDHSEVLFDQLIDW